MQLYSLLTQAKHSKWAKYKLNFVLSRMIPFNKKHGIKVAAVAENKVTCVIPYKKANFNHLRGIHACALATVAEFSSGLLLLTKVDLKKYRLIMADLRVVYHYQAKGTCLATASITTDVVAELQQQLQQQHMASLVVTSEIYDVSNNHIATVKTNWQLKAWQQVRTKV